MEADKIDAWTPTALWCILNEPFFGSETLSPISYTKYNYMHECVIKVAGVYDVLVHT